MLEINSVGDVVLSDARTIEALADEGRFDLVERMRRLGPATLDQLASGDADVPAMLGVLADVGLVTSTPSPDGERWTAVGRGLLLNVSEDPDAQAASRKLAAVMLLRNEGIPRQWAAEHEPRLNLAWFQATGMLNARLTMNPEELTELQEQIERLIEPYLNREPTEPTEPGLGAVRLLAYFLPTSS